MIYCPYHPLLDILEGDITEVVFEYLLRFNTITLMTMMVLMVMIDSIIDITMGGLASNDSNTDRELSFVGKELRQDIQHTTPEMQEGDCLFCGICEPKRRESQVWRLDFEECCRRLRESHAWVETVKRAGVEKEITRTNSMKDFVALKYEFSRKIRDKEVPNSIELKEILRDSALLEENVGEDLHTKEMCPRSSFQVKPGILKGRKTKPMVSVLDENMKALFLPKKMQRGMDQEMQSSIYLFVKFSEMMETHSQDPTTAICRVKLAFIDYVKEKYGKFKILSALQDEQLTRSTIEFISLYTILIGVYYKISTLSEDERVRTIFSYENLKSAVTVAIFKTEGFYSLLFSLYECSAVDREINRELSQIISTTAVTTPQTQKIAPEYCLNQSTVNYFIGKSSLEVGLGNIDIPVLQDAQPFEACVSKLKQIVFAQSPISKLKVIISTADKISDSIAHFYEINNIPIRGMVDSDQIISIFIFIILQAKVNNLKTHLRFISNFCTQEQLLSETGYYSTVAEGALKVLIDEKYQTEDDFC